MTDAALGAIVMAVPVAVVAGLAVRRWRRGAGRRSAMRAAVEHAGFAYLGRVQPFAGAAEFPLAWLATLGTATAAQFDNVAHCAFTYGDHFVFDFAPAGRGARARETVAVIRMNGVAFPAFALRLRKHRDAPPSELSGAHEPSFFGQRPLGRLYGLFAEHDLPLHDLLTPDVCERFAQLPRCGEIDVQGCGHWIAVWAPGYLMAPGEFLDVVKNAEQVTARLGKNLIPAA